jgi:hypothetical protein
MHFKRKPFSAKNNRTVHINTVKAEESNWKLSLKAARTREIERVVNQEIDSLFSAFKQFLTPLQFQNFLSAYEAAEPKVKNQ